METKFKIIEPEDYVLAVSDEEIKEGDWFLVTSGIGYKILSTQKAEYDNDGTKSWSDSHCKKIIAHTPKGNTPELDLLLLPEMVDNDDVEKLAELKYSIPFPHKFSNLNQESYKQREAFIKGYKAATKVYSEEDLRKAIDMTLREFVKDYQLGKPLFINEYENNAIQSLKQSKTPKWFVAEMEVTKSQVFRDGDNVPYATLKTTTINGKTYLVGHYE
jgi:hypothetical protein